MAGFKAYLTESFVSERTSNNADLAFQKILDRVDNGHIDMNKDCIEFHIGRLIKNSKLDVCLHIRRSDNDSVRLGKKDDHFYIVVDTREELPDRTAIDDFLSTHREVAQGVRKELQKYITDHMDHEHEPDFKTQGEDRDASNTSTHFEERYQLMMDRLNEKIKEYHENMELMKSEMKTENRSKRGVLKRAMELLAEEEFGEDVEGFKKVARGLMSQDESGINRGFANNLSPENKKRLDSRLESLYDQKIKPLLQAKAKEE